MATTNNSTNAVQLMADSLIRTLKPLLIEQITNEMVAQFKEQAVPVITEHVENIVIQNVDGVRDMLKIRDELNVYIEINGVGKDIKRG